MYLHGFGYDYGVEVNLIDKDFSGVSSKLQQLLLAYCKCSKCGFKMSEMQAYCEKCKNDQITSTTFVVDYEKWDEICKQNKKDENNKRRRENRDFHLMYVAGFHTVADIRQIWEFQNGECHYCGISLGSVESKHGFEKDHIEPISKLGSDWPSNLALTCIPCNQTKKELTAQAFWKILEKKHNKDWVLDRKAVVREITSKKKGLTKARQLELEQKLSKIKYELNKMFQLQRVEKGLPESYFDPIEIETNDNSSIKIFMIETGIEITLPSSFHRKLDKLEQKTLEAIASCLACVGYKN